MPSLTSFVPEPHLEEYAERFKEHFFLERRHGVLLARFHTNGGEAVWGAELHRAIGQLFHTVSRDRENEVLILTGTSDYWLRDVDSESFNAIEDNDETFRRESYYRWYRDGMKMQETLIWDIDIPTIGVINGPGTHSEFGLLCDITICADHARLVEAHFKLGLAPGDALFMVLQELIGLKRAAYAMYTAQRITPEEALEWGLINEILPSAELLPRAFQLAETILEQDPIVRRITSAIVKRPRRRRMTDDFEMHFGHEMWAAMVHKQRHAQMDTHGVLRDASSNE